MEFQTQTDALFIVLSLIVKVLKLLYFTIFYYLFYKSLFTTGTCTRYAHTGLLLYLINE